MEQLITFDKSLHERLIEYQDLLPDNLSAFKDQWLYYLDYAVDPNGWQAVWKIPRSTCEDLKIPFPTLVLVLVLEVKKLRALVRVMAVEDEDVHIPNKHSVPLIELWATKGQDKTVALNMKSTANAIDMLRFFYMYICMPWDAYDDDSEWKNKHLVSRLRLYYDMKNGIIPKTTSDHISSLLTEARHIQASREQIEGDLSETDDDDPMENKKVEVLMEHHVRMLEIKHEIDILEDPKLRTVIINRQHDLMTQKYLGKGKTYLVFEIGEIEAHIKFLEAVQKDYPNTNMTSVSSLANLLEFASVNSHIILSSMVHQITTLGPLEYGGKLSGVSNRLDTVIKSNKNDVMFNFKGNNVEIKNLTIDAVNFKCAILVNNGKLTLDNVKIVGDGCSSTRQGIIMLGGAKLELINCEIQGFSTGIVGNSGASIILKNCDIHHSNCGLKVFDNCSVSIENSVIHHCKDYGIILDTNTDDGRSFGGFEMLNILPNIRAAHIDGHNNEKADVVIRPKPQFKPIEDLFADPDVDPTIIEDDDAEMDEDNVTAIETDKFKNLSPIPS